MREKKQVNMRLMEGEPYRHINQLQYVLLIRS